MVDGVYNYVSGIDVDSLLSVADPPQTVSDNFQVKFGQKDNSFAPGDGLSFDDIVVKQQTDLTAGFRKPPYLTYSGREGEVNIHWTAH